MTRHDAYDVLSVLAPTPGFDEQALTSARALLDTHVARDQAELADDARHAPPLSLAGRGMGPIRHHALRRRRVLVGAAAVGVLAATASITVPLLSPDKAYASWTPTPTTLVGPALVKAATACEGDGGPLMTTVLAEQRGVFSFTLKTNGQQVANCLVNEVGTGGGSTADIHAMPAGSTDALVTTYFSTWGPDSGAATAVFGPAGDGVEAVTITRSNGFQIDATVSDGWWAAWWPGATDDDATMTVARSDGSVSDPMRLADNQSQEN